MKFRTKTILGVALIELILLGILIINVVSLLHSSNQNESLRKVKLTEALMLAASENAILAYDIATLESLADNILATEELTYIRFKDNDDNILVERWLLNTEQASTFNQSADNIEKTIPVNISGQISGYIQFGIDQSYMQSLLHSAIKRMAALAAFEILLVAAFSTILGIYLTKQLTSLTLASNRIRDGELGFTLPIKGTDEVSETIQAFNTMSTSLKRVEQTRADEAAKLALAHQRLRSLLDNFPFLIWFKDTNGRFLSVNKSFASACGKDDPQAVEGLTDFDLWPIDLANQYRLADIKVINSHKNRMAEEIIESQGQRTWVETFKSPVIHEGELIGTVGFSRDISERKDAEERQRKAEAIFNSASEGILLSDSHATVRMINPAFSEITGYSEAEILGQNASILSSGRHDISFYKAMYKTLDEEGFWQGEIWNRKKNGELYIQWQTVVALRNDLGDIDEYLAIFSDITRRKAAEDEIKFRANYDQLTGLPNRTLLSELLTKMLQQSHREAKQSAVMFLDLDHFKRINDTLGHAIGDLLLQKVANILQTTVRESDVVARLGGDEFIVLLSDASTAGAIRTVAEKIIQNLNEPLEIEQHQVHTCTSIGIAVYPEDGLDEADLLSNADLAMYKAKESGRGQYRFFNSNMSKEIKSSRAIELDLRQAIENAELTVAFQPIVALKDETTVGYETLMRWPAANDKHISVEECIRNAEEFGLIQPLFEVILDKAAARFVKLLRQQPSPCLYFSVNISSHQIPDQLSLDWIKDKLHDHGLTPGHLVLELTEGIFLSDSTSNLQWLMQARKIGFKVALDDFGTGYSSLAYLKRFTVDILKIDREFISGLESSTTDHALIKSVISLSDAFGLHVIAEGVETATQAEMLTQLGCQWGQGYFYGKPDVLDEKLS